MTQRKFHWLEKLQVQLASAAALFIVYFWLYPLVRPWDPNAALAFVPYGGLGQLAMLAGIVWALAAVAALLTTKSRPQGAMVAALIGAGGFCLRSPQMRTLLWLQGDGYAGLFFKLIGETVLLTVVLLGAAVIIAAVRRAVEAIQPAWMWSDPLLDAPQEKKSHRDRLFQALSCVGLMLALAIVLVIVLLRTADRGQIIFALLTANLLGMLAAHQVFPARSSVVAWVGPMLIGVLFYILAVVGALTHSDAGANLWASVTLYANPLPIDWMTAGAGGGVLGYWISERIHELRHIERHEQQAR